MRLAFMGTPEFSVPALAELIAAGHEIAAVYTRAPEPSGRGQKLRPSPVQEFAERHGIDVLTPRSFKPAEERARFAAQALDAAVVVAYGLILPKAVLEAPRFGCFNLHASLLPRWRGAAPIQRAIMAGDAETGVEVMRMEAGLDTGPVILSERVAIRADDTAGALAARLAQIGAGLLPRALAAIERGGAIETPQAAEGVTYAGKISSAEAKIDWAAPAATIDCLIRGMSPWPGAWCDMRGERVKILLSRKADGSGVSGQILEADGKLIVACGEGAVELQRLQRAGRSAQSAGEFLRGFPLRTGERL
jgi:methionyl-tRNA formyltransferase